MNNLRPQKRKRCKNTDCRELFIPKRTFQATCGPKCAIAFGASEAGKRHGEQAKRRQNKEDKQRLKTRSDYIKDAQVVFNRYVRTRDKNRPCISCGKTVTQQFLTGSGWDCGHYRSVGANPELRFEPHNAWKQCVKCNRDLSGNVVNYRIELQNRIGPEMLEWLEGPHEPKKYTIDDLKEIIATYKAKIKAMEK